MALIQVDGERYSLIPPFNPARCEELVAAAFPPPAEVSPVGPDDEQLAVYLLDPTPEEIAAAVITLTTLGTDPTRNDLSREEAAEAAILAHWAALSGLSAVDSAYALMGRMFAVKDGASQAVIDGIVDRPTAAAYVQSKPEWQNLTAASKQWEADSLDMLAMVFQVVLIKLL